LLKELKESLSSYKSEAISLSLTQLEKITSTLENDIGRTFTSIDTTITKNTDNLLLSYERFFAICETFNNKISEQYEDGTIEAIKSLNEIISKNIEKLDNQNNDLHSNNIKKQIQTMNDQIEQLTTNFNEAKQHLKRDNSSGEHENNTAHKSYKIHKKTAPDTLFKISLNYHEMGMWFPLHTLVKMAQKNEISKEYYICKTGENNWMPIESIKELRDAFKITI
jgi:exonuclease VII large subunit